MRARAFNPRELALGNPVVKGGVTQAFHDISVIFAINLALVVIHANDCWGTYLRLFVIFKIFAFSTSIWAK